MKKAAIGLVLALILLHRALADGAPGPTHQLIINEVMMGSEVNPDKDHWIELYNPNDEEILLFGWQIRGVTTGGQWINLVEEDYRAIQPGSYFLISHYTNSRSSALEVRPQVNKTSIQFPAGPIQIELQDPQGQLADQVTPERGAEEVDYRSFERVLPAGAHWHRSTGQVNLKTGLALTYATPFALNSDQVPLQPEEPPALLPTILINEILPNPKKRETEDEFIELLNGGGASVDLRGFELDDENLENDQSYFFIDEARDHNLEPGEFLVLYRAETQISLENSGDGVELFDEEGNLIDSYFYAPDLEGRSQGRNPENRDAWLRFNHPTPGAANVEVNHAPVPLITLQGDTRYMDLNVTAEDSYDPDGDLLDYFWEFDFGATDTLKNPLKYTYSTPGPKTVTLRVRDEFWLDATASIPFEAIVQGSAAPRRLTYSTLELISEFMVNPEGNDEAGEWIELFNPTAETLYLAGWYLDDAEGASAPFKIPQDTSLEPGQYLVFKEPELGLSLKNSEDQVRLLDPNREPKQVIGYADAQENWSHARDATGSFAWTSFFTPGQLNRFPTPLVDGLTVSVLRVVDGDTIVVELDNQPVTLRLIGVDTPETVHPHKPVQYFGEQASDYLKSRLEGQTIRLAFDEQKADKYDRLLAYVYLGEEFVNAELVEQGYGVAYTRFPFIHLDQFIQLEAEAKAGGRGLWQNVAVGQWITTRKDEETLFVGGDEVKMAPVSEIPEVPEQAEKSFPDCRSSQLQIDSILPNSKKGETIEFIRLKNSGAESACLAGWALDDAIGKGSKPFEILGGAIEPGGVRTFRQSETKVKLNNKDDCASLLNPEGLIADQICYGATHKNEIFTHAGGDWQPKKRVAKSRKKTGSALVKSSATSRGGQTRPPSTFTFELATELAEGRILTINELEKLVYAELPKQGIIPFSYASGPLSELMNQSVLDFGQPLQLQFRQTGDTKTLMALQPIQNTLRSTPARAAKDDTSFSSSALPLQITLLSFMVWLALFAFGRVLWAGQSPNL